MPIAGENAIPNASSVVRRNIPVSVRRERGDPYRGCVFYGAKNCPMENRFPQRQ